MSSFASIMTTHNYWIRVCPQVLGDCRTTLFNHISWGSLLEIEPYGWHSLKSSIFTFLLFLCCIRSPQINNWRARKPLKIKNHFPIPGFQGPYFLSSICSALSFDSVGFVHCRPVARVSQKTYVHEHRMRPAKAKLTRENLKHCVFLDTWMSTAGGRIGFGFWWPECLTWSPCLASLWFDLANSREVHDEGVQN